MDNGIYLQGVSKEEVQNWVRESVKDAIKVITDIPSKEKEEPLLNRKEVAKLLNTSFTTLHKRINEGLPYLELNGKKYFLRSKVILYMEKNPLRKNRFK
jgi:hypothetical protein